ncbi:YggS family pyridoxal phosphate-dependent enzyme [Ectothiorhodospiraceae bacterium 2226]|nr:YggS family pyridoxal phosphate-dependent enzyme [Ectothiorhodospiraceae bacterium 2226]
MTGNTSDLSARLARVHQRMRAAEAAAGRPPGDTHLLAVSKYQPAAAIRALAARGQRDFGESYAQEALEKMGALRDLDLTWHYIGPLQSNKTRAVAEHFHWAHSLDSLKLAERLNAQRPAALPPLEVCLQVNLSGEAQKRGVAPSELPALAHAVAALPRLRLRGLMTLPRRSEGGEAQRAPFRALREARERLRAEGLALDVLSMGMSEDLEAAIMEGSDWIRIGTALFGERPDPRRAPDSKRKPT